MENTGISKYTISFGLSLALASVINALLVVAKEEIPGRYVGIEKPDRSALDFSCCHRRDSFCRVRLDFSRPRPGGGVAITANRLIGVLVAGVVLGGLIIVGFYLAAG